MLLQFLETQFRRRLTRAIALPILLLLLLAGVSIWQITRLLSALQSVDHTNQVISQSNHVQKLLLDMETGFRGYMLTGQREFLEPYDRANLVLASNLEQLKTLVSADPGQVYRVDELMAHVWQWKQQILPAITRRQQGEPESVSNFESRKQRMDEMRQQISVMISTEEQRRNDRSLTAQQTARSVILTSLVLALGVGAILAYFIRRQIMQVSHTYEDALRTTQARTEEAEKLAAALQWNAQRLAALHNIDRAILAAEDDTTLVSDALTQLRQIVPHQQAFVVMFDFEADTALILAGSSQTEELYPPVGTLLPIADVAPEHSNLNEVDVENLSVIKTCPPMLMQLQSNRFCSCLRVPLAVENRLVGELNLASITPAVFTSESQGVAREVAAQLAIAIQHSRLQRQLQVSNQQLQRELRERQQAEIELREQEQLFRSTFNQAAVGIAHVSPTGQWLRVNQRLCEIVGYTREELLQHRFQDLTHVEDLETDLTYIRQILANEISTYSMEKRYLCKDRSIVWVNLTVSLVREADGRPKYFISVIQDISDRKGAELALQQLNLTLEQRVIERTAQLEEINQELEAFTYSVSHDLRAPLRTMQGFAAALSEDCGNQLEDVCKTYIDSIIDDAVQMNGLISDLLNYSRLTRAQINLQPTDLEDVIDEALRQLATQIEETHAQIHIASPLAQVMAHRSTLIQVMTNLIANAIKFTEADTQPQIDIFIASERQDKHEWIQLWIVDNGIGIAPEHQERVFRVFERLHGVERYPGTGIGLAIVRKGLDRMGGRVGVEAQLGQGSRFWIALPSAVSSGSKLINDPTSSRSSN